MYRYNTNLTYWLIIALIVIFISIFSKRNQSGLSLRKTLRGGENANNLPDSIIICSGQNQAQTETQVKLEPSPSLAAQKKEEMCYFEFGTDYFGNTYQTLKAKDHRDCCQLCIDDKTRCKGFAYDRSEGVCRLKTAKGLDRTSCSKRIAGYVK